MEDFKQILRSQLAKKRLNNQSIGAFVISLLKKKVVSPEEFGGYVRGNTVYVKLGSMEDKARWFVEKSALLAELNTALVEFGYDKKLSDIKIKS
ncbi:MAG: hypothetical protein H6765_03550 [Candidatus Peribacteria bacterium]|nr:MAG: hypothetical protein H6765_03550 [Candidatus Peribacteria bacterium]